MTLPHWVEAHGEGSVLRVLVQPRASRSKVLGEHDGRLKIALAAPPVDGEANTALLELIAELLELRRGDLELLDGHTGRRKRLAIRSMPAHLVAVKLAAR